MTDLEDIFITEETTAGTSEKSKKTTVTEKRSRKKKDYSDEEKQAIKERLRLGKQRASEEREKAKESKSETTVKKVLPKKDTSEKKTIFDINDMDIDPSEMKHFLSKLYKASKSQIVKDAMDKYEPVSANIQNQKPEPIKKEVIQEKQPQIDIKTKEEMEYKEKLDKIKKQLANKKRR